jgi:hypothetical protein
MCCGQTSGSYAASLPFGAVSGRNHRDTWAGCMVSLTIPTRPLPTNLMLMVLVSWGGGEVYSYTSTSSPGHGNFGGGSSIPLHTTRRSSLIPSPLDDPVVIMVDEECVE